MAILDDVSYENLKLQLISCLLGTVIMAAAPAQGAWTAIEKSVEVEAKQKDGSTAKEMRSLACVCVDRVTGDVYGFINGSGLWKSSDQCKTFTLVYDNPKGRIGSSFSLWIDPADGKRLFALLHGVGSALTLDGGKTWIQANQEGLWSAVDWADPEAKTILTRNGGHSTWMITQDRGKSWNTIAKGREWSWTFGVFDAKTWICNGKDTLARTDDGGSSFGDCGKAIRPRTAVMTVFKDSAYLLCADGLAVSKDKGKTWIENALPKDIGYGPYFGKDENQIVVASKTEGFFESTDAGKTWKNVTKLTFAPAEIHDVPTQGDHGGTGTAGYDPIHDTFYFCSSGHPAQKFQR